MTRDDQGQMMVLAAVLLVIGLIALAGMVARVNQLGSQTAVESNQAILGELPPLADAIEEGVTDLKQSRTVSGVTGSAGNPTITGPASSGFQATDVGLAVTGTGIPIGARVTAYATVGATTTVTLSSAPTGAVSGSVAVGRFALTSTSAPTLQDGIVALMEHLQELEAGHGLLLDYEISCDSTAGVPDAAKGIVIAHLSDGTVWTEVRTTSAAYFPRLNCDSVSG